MGSGAVLLQEREDGVDRSDHYLRKSYTYQLNYIMIKRESLTEIYLGTEGRPVVVYRPQALDLLELVAAL